MNIATLGYYGFGNAGDEAILDNLRHFLSPHTVIPIPLGLSDSAGTVNRLNAFDFLILGGGGLYRNEPPSPFGTFDQWGKELTVPMGVLGLGISRLAPRFAAATGSLIERSLFFQVRDEESRRLLAHPKVELAPDLTFFRPLAPASGKLGEEQIVCGVNLRPAQAGTSRWIAAVQELDCRKVALPFSVHPTLGDREALLSLDPQCPGPFSREAFASIDILIGTAFHSIVFAVQMGIPVIALNYDPKVERFMREVELSDYMLGWDEPHRLHACYERALACRDTIRQQMLAYRAAAHCRLQQALEEPRRAIDRYEKNGTHLAPHSVPARPSLPKVTIIVHGRELSQEATGRTLNSCLNQTHPNLEVILATEPTSEALPDNLIQQPDTPGRLRRLSPDSGASDRVAAGLQAATGEYVTWLETGDWYVPDALAALVAALEQNRAVDAAHACFYLTRDGVIERKVCLDTPHKPGKATRQAPFLLVRRSAARQIWQQTRYNGAQGRPWQSRAVYLQNALFYKQSSCSESDLYQALVAFGRGDFGKGEQLLARAATAGWEKRWTETTDLAELIAATARNTRFTATPEEFVALLFNKLPAAAPGLSALRRRVLAQLAMRRVFERYRESGRLETFRALLSAIGYDPAWLANRGIWMVMLRLCLGRLP
jgi:hypothetical protein